MALAEGPPIFLDAGVLIGALLEADSRHEEALAIVSEARAFLANPEILLLDEPTSSVEPESEAIITQALERLMRGRTTFVTSHRFSLVRGADRIIALDMGRVVEQGSHDELVAADGLYASMYRRQVGEDGGRFARAAAAHEHPASLA